MVECLSWSAFVDGGASGPAEEAEEGEEADAMMTLLRCVWDVVGRAELGKGNECC